MKKLFFAIIFFLVFTSSVNAQTRDLTVSITPTPTLISAPIIYELPYPGILPGSPLYNLKAIRDRIIEFLISDPLKKADFYLLQSDKRLSASIVLFEKGEYTLSESTLSKGQNYFEKSLEKAIEAKKIKGNVNDFYEKIKKSNVKQKQEIKKLLKRAKGEVAAKLDGDLKRSQNFEKRVEEIKL